MRRQIRKKASRWIKQRSEFQTVITTEVPFVTHRVKRVGATTPGEGLVRKVIPVKEKKGEGVSRRSGRKV